MGWKLKTIVFLTLAVFLAGCAWLCFVVYARYQGNDYLVDITASFNAASLVNGEETYTDPDRAVISTYEGQSYVIIPENYKAVVSLLRKDHVMTLFRRIGKDAPLKITVCGSAEIRIEPDRGSDDGALIDFVDAGGKRYVMHVRGGNIWKQFIEYATVGHSVNRNLPL